MALAAKHLQVFENVEQIITVELELTQAEESPGSGGMRKLLSYVLRCRELQDDLRRRDIEGKQRLENDFVSATRTRWVVPAKRLVLVPWHGCPFVQVHQMLDSGC